jgi:hypothetical protein
LCQDFPGFVSKLTGTPSPRPCNASLQCVPAIRGCNPWLQSVAAIRGCGVSPQTVLGASRSNFSPGRARPPRRAHFISPAGGYSSSKSSPQRREGRKGTQRKKWFHGLRFLNRTAAPALRLSGLNHFGTQSLRPPARPFNFPFRWRSRPCQLAWRATRSMPALSLSRSRFPRTHVRTSL